MGSSGTTFQQGMEKLLDIDEATRMYVVHTLCGITDTYWFAANFHNVIFHELPAAERFVILGWDNDFAFCNSTSAGLWGGPNLAKLYGIPQYERLFYGHLKDIVDDFYNVTYMRPWTDHYGALAQETSAFNTVLNYIGARGTYALSRIPAQVAFAITTNGGNNFVSDVETATLQGTGWINVRSIMIPSLAEDPVVTWPTRSTWSLSVPLFYGENALSLYAVDFSGDPIAVDTIVITSTVGPKPDEFIRGDANRDLRLDISDAMTTLFYLFGGRQLLCLDAADADDNEFVNITDVIYTLNWLFRAGSAPPAPFPASGPDTTGGGALGCQ
jgi:hypothetical protein